MDRSRVRYLEVLLLIRLVVTFTPKCRRNPIPEVPIPRLADIGLQPKKYKEMTRLR